MGLPLRFRDEIVGLIFLIRAGEGRFSARAVERATALLPSIAVAERALRATKDRSRLHSAFDTLGAREKQVALMITEGLQSKEIAASLGTSFHTVRRQTLRVFAKLGVRGRTQLAAALAREGLAGRR